LLAEVSVAVITIVVAIVKAGANHVRVEGNVIVTPTAKREESALFVMKESRSNVMSNVMSNDRTTTSLVTRVGSKTVLITINIETIKNRDTQRSQLFTR
jgi:phage antirepressor YoqD-like protein